MSKYDFELNLKANDTNPKIIELIRESSTVLEFGSANGRLTHYLKQEKKCTIDIVEIDFKSGSEAAQFADIACIGSDEGDIEKFLWCNRLHGRKYEYIIFADVLEHLYKPDAVVERCKEFLCDDGIIIVSIPNIAHDSIVANLLVDKFEYHSVGLLDSTHVKFFSYYSFKEMIKKIGLKCSLAGVVCHRINETEFNIDENGVSEYVRRTLLEHDKGRVYQYVFCVTFPKLNITRSIDESDFQVKLPQFYFIKYFWMEEGDCVFTEEKSQVWWIDPREKKFVLPWDNSRIIKALRIDPLNYKTIIKINSINIICGADSISKSYVTNGFCIDDAVYSFSSNTSQILVENVEKQFEYISLDIEYLLFDNMQLLSLEKIFLNNQEKITNQQEKIAKLGKLIVKQEEEIEMLKEDNKMLMEFKDYVLGLKIWKILKKFNIVKK